MESLGVRLRMQREQRQVSLASIADKTKIKLSLLEALERDDVSRWPTGIFRRSYIRAYASAIGLDAEATACEFLRRFPDPAEDVGAALELHGANSGSGRPPTRLRFLLSSAIGVLPTRRQTAPPADTPEDGHSFLQLRRGIEPECGVDRAVGGTADAPLPAAAADPTNDAERPGPGAIAASDVGGGPAHEEPRAVASVPAYSGVDMMTVAALCSRLARAEEADELPPLLTDFAEAVAASGLILWMWEPRLAALSPVVASGYSERVLSHITPVRRDTDNAIAAAFRTGAPQTVAADGTTTGALAVPIVGMVGCVGVLALELADGCEQDEHVRAAALIVAAQLSAFVGAPVLSHAVSA